MATRPAREVSAARLLRAHPLFEGVAPEVTERLGAFALRRSLSPGEALFRAGEPPAGMYVVVYGTLRLLASGARGRRLTGVVGSGQSFGEPVMFLEHPALVDAVAAEDCLVLQLPRDAVLAEIRRDPGFALCMLAALSQRIQGLVQELGRHASGSARSRLLDFLARHASGPAHDLVVLPATKAAVAAQLLVTPAHFSRLLGELSREGLVEVRGREVRLVDAARFSRAAASSRGAGKSARSGRAPPPP
jgi:CRP-like cAMP-binding protein